MWVAGAAAGALVGTRVFLGAALGGALAVTMFGIQRRLAHRYLARAASGGRARALLWLYWLRLPPLGVALFYLLRTEAASLPALCFGVGVVPMAILIAAMRPGAEV